MAIWAALCTHAHAAASGLWALALSGGRGCVGGPRARWRKAPRCLLLVWHCRDWQRHVQGRAGSPAVGCGLWRYYRGRQPAAACRGGGWHRRPCAPCSLLRSGAQAGRVMDGTRPVLGVPVRAWRHQRLWQLRPMWQCAGAGSGRGDTCGHAWRLGTRRSISGTLAGPCAGTGAGVQAAAGRQGMCFSAHPESAARRATEKMRFGGTFPYRHPFTGLWQQRQAIMGRQSPCRSRRIEGRGHRT